MPSPALDFGRIIHLGIESLYEADLSHAYTQMRNAAVGSSIEHLGPNERRSLPHAELLLRRYQENYNPDPLKGCTNEKKHTAVLGCTPSGILVRYRGTVDGLKDTTLIERKTSTWLGTSFINRINPSDQATGYAFLATDLLGTPVTEIIYDGLGTTGYGLKSDPKNWPINKRPADLFARAITHRSPEAIGEWKSRVLYDVERLAQDVERGSFSVNAPDACTAFNSMCPYANLCRASETARENLISNSMTEEPWASFAINS